MFFKRLIHPEVKIGDAAPDFTLPAQDGRLISLKDFRGKCWVVLYFYPKDNTYGCVAESCDFRDHYPVFRGANAEVLGVSSDSPESHARFSQKYKLPFTLLSDLDGKVRKAYGVRATLSVIPGRVTFVIDPDGIVRHAVNSQFNPKSHVAESLAAIQKRDGNA